MEYSSKAYIFGRKKKTFLSKFYLSSIDCRINPISIEELSRGGKKCGKIYLILFPPEKLSL